VLVNLAGNAVKFTEQGQVSVCVALEREEESRIVLRFTVKDTGIGMSEVELEKLFKPFTQADTSVTRRFGGTGLGLTISKRLVEMMGGEIRAESVAGEGSSFVFTAGFGQAEQVAGEERQIPPHLRNMRVLAVDDNESSLQVLKDYLESFGFEVVLARDGRDALGELRRAHRAGIHYGLVVLDWRMPQMDGVELAREVRKVEGTETPPRILLISAYGLNEMQQNVDYELVDGVLAKPFHSTRLLDAILDVFSEKKDEETPVRVGAQFDPRLVARIRGAKLLLVEDNEINQQVARELLEGVGVSVMIAENGREAITLLGREAFDGVLMDMQMPVMDGLTATHEIRKNPKYARLPIIALTANVMSSDQGRILEAGMNDHLGKPIDPDRLVATLARWIRPMSAGPAPVVQAPVSPVAKPGLPELDGVNVAASVKRLGGNVALYRMLLDQFRNKERDAAERVRQALAGGNYATAERVVHTLRGSSGSLGAVALQAAAESLELAIKRGEEGGLESLLAQFEQELASFIGKLDSVVELRGA
jgi:CheY-like chemotaxis protein/HPt (histidine-containing phosphotransfer) domain-containing protein/anti-sigma regulatory factor (Ser/Thr protein kinase)